MQIELKITKKQFISIFGIALLAGVFYLSVQATLYFNHQYEKDLIQRENLVEVLGVKKDNRFEDLVLSANSYLVWDVKHQRKISSLNEEIQFPMASLTKLMTVLVASNHAKSNSVLTIQEENLNTEGESGLVLNEKWNLKDLIDFVLITSSNDGASALGSVISSLNTETNQETFIRKMNNTAKDLGMTQSFFLNESGLDINEKISGAYGSVRDVVILMEHILEENPSLLKASVLKEIQIDSDSVVHQTKNTNIIVDKLPGVLASKTGFTDLAGGNLVMAFDIGLGHNVIISVMGSTKEARFEDMEKLYWASVGVH